MVTNDKARRNYRETDNCLNCRHVISIKNNILLCGYIENAEYYEHVCSLCICDTHTKFDTGYEYNDIRYKGSSD